MRGMEMSENEVVSKETCKECKTSFQKQIDELSRVTEKRLDSHADDIKELTRISDRMVDLMSDVRDQNKIQSKRMDDYEKHVIALENAIKINSAEQTAEDQANEKVEVAKEKVEEVKEKQENRSYDKKARILYPIIVSTVTTFLGFILGLLIK
jgi:coenzyme F420-reducing hydrogenase alpha subunit